MVDRVVVPHGRATPPPDKGAEEVGPARLLKALQVMDQNAADRARDLKVFLCFLPLLWGLIWGVFYLIILALR